MNGKKVIGILIVMSGIFMPALPGDFSQIKKGITFHRKIHQMGLDMDLYNAVRDDDVSYADTLLQQGANPNYRSSAEKAQEFFEKEWARDSSKSVQSLLAFLFSSFIPEAWMGREPLLSIAIDQKSPKMVQLLLYYKANPEIGRIDVHAADYFRRNYVEMPIIQAIESENEEIIRLLVKYKVRLNRPVAVLYNKELVQWTPLMYAISLNLKSIVSLLVELGADVNVSDKQGITPLRLAQQLQLPEIEKILIEKGAKADTWGAYFKRLKNKVWATQ